MSTRAVPEPMVPIGYRPILWHVMKYYAHFDHKDFILCLGYKADVVKEYFLNYDECISNNFVLSNGGKKVRLLNSDIQDWNITFVDTGISSNIGQRLMAIRPYLHGESAFLANYSDGLTDLPLKDYVDSFLKGDRVGSFLAVRPPQSSHVASFDGDVVSGVRPSTKPVSGSTVGFLSSARQSLITCAMAKTSLKSPSAASSNPDNSSDINMRATGVAWIPSKTSNNWRIFTLAARRLGKYGGCRKGTER